MAVIETKSLCLVRCPPGDRWKEPDGTEIFPTLTAALEQIFRTTGIKEYRFSAQQGEVYTIVTEEEKAVAPKKYSLYGDEDG